MAETKDATNGRLKLRICHTDPTLDKKDDKRDKYMTVTWDPKYEVKRKTLVHYKRDGRKQKTTSVTTTRWKDVSSWREGDSTKSVSRVKVVSVEWLNVVTKKAFWSGREVVDYTEFFHKQDEDKVCNMEKIVELPQIEDFCEVGKDVDN